MPNHIKGKLSPWSLEQAIVHWSTWAKTQGSRVFHASSDADLMIVKKLLKPQPFLCPRAKKKCTTTNPGHSASKVWLGAFHLQVTCSFPPMLCWVVIQPQDCLVLKKFKVNTCLQQTTNVFDQVISSPAEIESAGKYALVAVCSWKKSDSLDNSCLAKQRKKSFLRAELIWTTKSFTYKWSCHVPQLYCIHIV